MKLQFTGDVKVETLASGNGYLFDPTTGYVYLLNSTAAVAVNEFLAGGDATAATQRLVDEFDVAVEVAEADVAAFVRAMSELGIAKAGA